MKIVDLIGSIHCETGTDVSLLLVKHQSSCITKRYQSMCIIDSSFAVNIIFSCIYEFVKDTATTQKPDTKR